MSDRFGSSELRKITDMVGQWSLVKNLLGSPGETVPAAPAPKEQPLAEDQKRILLAKGPLDAVGQQSENIRERVNNLSERLEELKTLAGDFGQIVEPLNDFVTQHTATRSKLLEVEALLAREREVSQATRAQLSELHASAVRTSSELATVLVEYRSQEERGREQEAEITRLQLRIEDLNSNLENFEKQLLAETERARAVSDENQTLRIDLEAADQARSRAESEVAETREIISLSDSERARLQQLSEGLTHKVAALTQQAMDLDAQLQSLRQDNSVLQARLSAEQVARQKVEAGRDVERSAQQLEYASLTVKIDGLAAHAANTEKLLAHAREQLRERSDALRASEKSLKEAVAEKLAADRRAEAMQESANRHAAQMQELQKSNSELRERCDMLTKAVRAKESLLDSSVRKAADLAARIDQMTARFEQERAQSEMAHRRLIEELQSEKAERSLAQGALDIARGSRTRLLAQYTALKRHNSASLPRSGPEDLEQMADGGPEPPDNVRMFKSAE